jgi:hypothetical protein
MSQSFNLKTKGRTRLDVIKEVLDEKYKVKGKFINNPTLQEFAGREFQMKGDCLVYSKADLREAETFTYGDLCFSSSGDIRCSDGGGIQKYVENSEEFEQDYDIKEVEMDYITQLKQNGFQVEKEVVKDEIRIKCSRM